MPYLRKSMMVALCLLLSGITKAQSFTYEACLVQKDAINIAFSLEICNNTNTALTDFSILFDWPGFTDVTNDYGIQTVQNGSVNNQVEFTNIQWGPGIPANGCATFTIRGKHAQGMFISAQGSINGTKMTNIPCYIPSAADNFACEFKLNKGCGIHTGALDKDTWDPTEGKFDVAEGEIRLGQGTIYHWNAANKQVYIPANRYDWAVSSAVAHTLFTNLMGVDLMSINEYMATSKQEIDCGCDPLITTPAWVTAPYQIQPALYCKDYSGGVAVGFFQQEKGTGWLELAADIPCIYGVSEFSTVAIDGEWGTQIINKVYHDYNNVRFWELVKGWDPINFLKGSQDPYAAEKLIALAYNRGMNDGDIQNILQTNRAAAIADPDLLNAMVVGGTGFTYAEQISRTTAVLDNKLGSVSNLGTTTSGVPFPASHAFNSFFDQPITWNDVNTSLTQIMAFYAATGLVDEAAVRAKVKATFDGINGGGPVGFRYEIAPVIDEIVFCLPAFDPAEGLANVYGNSGGNDVIYPTARLEGGDTVCPGSDLELVVYLTGTAPWELSYLDNKGNLYIENNITISPFIFSVPDTGSYWLESMSDASGTDGAFKCDPETLAYEEKGGTAELIAYGGTGCFGDSLRIDVTGDAPWIITYNDPAGAEQTVTLNPVDTPYIFPFPVVGGDYVLTELSSGGCVVELDDTANVKNGGTPPDAKILTPDTSICFGDTAQIRLDFDGQGPFELKYTIDGLPQTHVTNIVDSFYTIPVWIGVSITLDSLFDSNCKTGLTESIVITVDPLPVVNIGPDSIICDTEAPFTLDAENSGSTYLWNDATTNQTLDVSNSGTYDVKVTTAAGCTASDTVTITINTTPIVNLGNDTTICATGNGGVIFDAQNNGATYVWNDNSTNQTLSATATGDYSVTVSNEGCSQSDTVHLTIGGDLDINLGNDTSICAGTLTIDAGATGDSYLWNDGTSNSTLNITSSGTYSVLVSSTIGCEGRDTIEVTINPYPVVSLRNDTTICASAGALILDAGNPGLSYTWEPTNETTQTISVSSTNLYKVEVSENGCSTTDSVQITVLGSVVLDLGNDTILCSHLGDLTLQANKGFDSYEWGDGTTNDFITISTSGIYEVEVVDASGCTANDTIQVTINTTPVVDLVDSVKICATSPAVVFDAKNVGATYVWSSLETTQTVTKGPNDAGDYWVIATVNNCSDSDTVNLSIATKLEIDLGDDVEICTGTTFTIDSKFGNGFTKDWNNTGAGTEQTLNSGAATVTVLVEDAGGCSGRDTIIITEINPLKINLGNDTAICLGSAGVTFGIPNNKAGMSVVSWNDLSTNYTLSTTTAGEYWLEVDSAGCIARDTVALVVNNLPIVSLGTDTFICKGTTPTITLDAGNFVSYQWANLNPIGPLGTNQTQNINTIGLYAVGVIDINGCTNSDTIIVSEKESTIYSLGNDTTICPGGNATISVPDDLQTMNNATWTWLNDASSLPDFLVENQVDGNVLNIILEYTNEFGCSSNDTVKITVDNELPITALKDTAICEGENLILQSGYDAAGYTFEWHDASNNPDYTITNAAVSQTGNISVDIESTEGCTGSKTIALTVHSNPNPQLSANSICIGQERILDHGLTDVTSLWTTGETTTSIIVSTANTYGVAVTNNNTGCKDTASVKLVVNTPPIVNLGINQIVCDGDSITLATGYDDINFSNLWTNEISASTGTITIKNSGTYEVAVTEVSTSCTGKDTIELVFNSVPDVILQNDTNICLGESLTIISNENDPTYTYDWSTFDSGTSITVTQSGLYTLTVSNGNCADTDEVNVIVDELPLSSLLSDTVVCFENELRGITLESGPDGTTYLWNTGETESSIVVSNFGTYSVTITNDANCSITDFAIVKNECPAHIWLPNSFTLDGNGLNDTWVIQGTGIETVEVLVFNRWGELIWTGNGLGDFWDGTHQKTGNAVQQDVYVYKVTYTFLNINQNLKSKTKVGTVAVIR